MLQRSVLYEIKLILKQKEIICSLSFRIGGSINLGFCYLIKLGNCFMFKIASFEMLSGSPSKSLIQVSMRTFDLGSYPLKIKGGGKSHTSVCLFLPPEHVPSMVQYLKAQAIWG